MLVTLREILEDERYRGKAVPAFNVYGYEDSKAIIEAAEDLGAPVILMTNRDAVKHMPIEIMAGLLRSLGENTRVPLCIHLDHGKTIEEIEAALEAGYTSVMYDGSQLPLEENIKNTQRAVKLAKERGVSVEAEIGSVGYSDSHIQASAAYTEAEEAKVFYESTGVDALAVAVGTIHRMQSQGAQIHYKRLGEIEKVVDIPLVIHGSTGVMDEDLEKLSHTAVGKVNIGTALRMAFGNTLREVIQDSQEFDRVKLFKKPMEEVKKAAYNKYKILGF